MTIDNAEVLRRAKEIESYKQDTVTILKSEYDRLKNLENIHSWRVNPDRMGS
jgi:hypothetical protein